MPTTLSSGTPDFSGLTADVYELQYGPTSPTGGVNCSATVCRGGITVFFTSTPTAAVRATRSASDGDYYIESRRLGGRNLDPEKYERDAELLLAEVERNPDDPRSVFYLAQSYYDYGDIAAARSWYERRSQMGGYDEEVYYSLARVAESMSRLGEPWPDVQDAYLRAWEFRPSRAEPLYTIAHHTASDQRYQLGYLFAERAARIPIPEADVLFLGAEVYTWRALDEQAVCASWIGKPEETVAICRQLLGRDDIPEADRQRIAGNRDVATPPLIEAAAAYPDSVGTQSFCRPARQRRDRHRGRRP